MVNTNYTQSPRKVYQVSRNTLAPDYVPPPENMHTYVKVLDNCDSNSPTVSSSGNARFVNNTITKQHNFFFFLQIIGYQKKLLIQIPLQLLMLWMKKKLKTLNFFKEILEFYLYVKNKLDILHLMVN